MFWATRDTCGCASKSFAQCGHGSCDPRPLQSKTQNHLRQSPLQRTPPHRKCILPSQGLSKSGNPLRQTRKKLDTSKNLDDGTNMRSSVRTGQIRIVNKPESSGLALRRLESVQGFLEVSNFLSAVALATLVAFWL